MGHLFTEELDFGCVFALLDRLQPGIWVMGDLVNNGGKLCQLVEKVVSTFYASLSQILPRKDVIYR